jgi:Mn-containing catalase
MREFESTASISQFCRPVCLSNTHVDRRKHDYSTNNKWIPPRDAAIRDGSGELSTLNNYIFQSAEEFGHVELVTTSINLLTTGSSFQAPPDLTPLQNAKDLRNTAQFVATAQTALATDSMGNSWRGDYVFSSGNLVLDLLHNFFLEVGARTHKMRVYEMTDHPTAREMIGYLLVRGGTHVLPYAKAIEIATGTDLTKMLPIPSLDNSKFDYARKFEEKGLNNVLYTWSEGDYLGIKQIWKGTNPENGERLRVIEGAPEGAPIPNLDDLPEEFAPGITKDHYEQIAKQLLRNL